MSDLKFRVKWKATLNGEVHEGIEEEASWFLVDQQGHFYSYGPMRPVVPCDDDYDELIPLIKIKGRYMSISDIESTLDDIKELTGVDIEALPQEESK